MALILSKYYSFFVVSRIRHEYFQQGNVSYFDPVEREFIRINLANGDTPQEHWIPLPVINCADLYRNYFRLMGNSAILQDYGPLDDYEFMVKVAFLADDYRFEDSLSGYTTCCINEIILDWVAKNNIPNCKMNIIEPFWNNDVSGQTVREYRREQYRLEELQEEEFKKTMRQ